MGCCLSTTTVPKTNHPDVNHLNHSHQCSNESELKGGAPPPPPPPAFEEETVKEVLSESETPIPKPPTSNSMLVIDNQSNDPPQVPQLNIDTVTVLPIPIKPTEEIIVSEVSEMCSFTESFSTTTLTDKRDDEDGEVTQRVHRSPAKIPRKRPYSGELARKERGVRPPVRRSEPSPEKRGQLPSRSVPGKTTVTQRRNMGPPNVVRRDPAVTAARRSRSPVKCGEAGPRRNLSHRSQSFSTTGQPGGRSPVRAAENERKGKLEKLHDGVLPETTSESLENPLVSLECFIFL